jgi:hypothetical protein
MGQVDRGQKSEDIKQEAGNRLRLGDARGIGSKSASGELVHLVGNRFRPRYNAKKNFALILILISKTS